MIKEALILAAAIVVAGFLTGGRFTSSAAQGFVYVTDRFTGATSTCGLGGCSKIENSN